MSVRVEEMQAELAQAGNVGHGVPYILCVGSVCGRGAHRKSFFLERAHLFRQFLHLIVHLLQGLVSQTWCERPNRTRGCVQPKRVGDETGRRTACCASVSASDLDSERASCAGDVARGEHYAVKLETKNPSGPGGGTV